MTILIFKCFLKSKTKQIEITMTITMTSPLGSPFIWLASLQRETWWEINKEIKFWLFILFVSIYVVSSLPQLNHLEFFFNSHLFIFLPTCFEMVSRQSLICWYTKTVCFCVCLTTFWNLRHGCRPYEAHISLACELTAEFLGVSSKTAECHFQTCGGIFLRLLSVPVACRCWATTVWIICLRWVKAPEGRAETAECVDLNV